MAGQRPLRRLVLRVGTTPGLLTVLAAGLAALALGSGLVGLVTVQHRVALVRDVGAYSGPLSVAAQNIYRSLSDADATAASAFLANGVEPAALRARYVDNIAQATAALTAALRGADDRGAAKLAVLSAELPVYAGLIETARAYNRQGLPLGAAYLREASGLLRQTLLPAAHELFVVETNRLAAAQRGATTFPWAVLLLGLSTLILLAAVQVIVTRRTNRLLNLGLVVATLAALISLAWSTVVLVTAADHIEGGRRDGSAQVQLLAQARAAALQARADEALTLIARGDGAAFETDFGAMLQRLFGPDGSAGLLGQALSRASNPADRAIIEAARQHARQWLSVHTRLRALDNSGQYVEAVKMATDAGPESPSTAFGLLDAALTSGITATNNRFDRRATQARAVLRDADAAIVGLTALLLVGAVAGLQRRIGEYR